MDRHLTEEIWLTSEDIFTIAGSPIQGLRDSSWRSSILVVAHATARAIPLLDSTDRITAEKFIDLAFDCAEKQEHCAPIEQVSEFDDFFARETEYRTRFDEIGGYNQGDMTFLYRAATILTIRYLRNMLLGEIPDGWHVKKYHDEVKNIVLPSARHVIFMASNVRPATRKTEGRWQSNLCREIFGNPFRPVAIPCTQRAFAGDWLTPNVVAIARATYQTQEWDRLPVLADALEDAGCTNRQILTHLREPGWHVRGCWALDLLLGKE